MNAVVQIWSLFSLSLSDSLPSNTYSSSFEGSSTNHFMFKVQDEMPQYNMVLPMLHWYICGFRPLHYKWALLYMESLNISRMPNYFTNVI